MWHEDKDMQMQCKSHALKPRDAHVPSVRGVTGNRQQRRQRRQTFSFNFDSAGGIPDSWRTFSSRFFIFEVIAALSFLHSPLWFCRLLFFAFHFSSSPSSYLLSFFLLFPPFFFQAFSFSPTSFHHPLSIFSLLSTLPPSIFLPPYMSFTCFFFVFSSLLFPFCWPWMDYWKGLPGPMVEWVQKYSS